jgi:hypothetical protein
MSSDLDKHRDLMKATRKIPGIENWEARLRESVLT